MDLTDRVRTFKSRRREALSWILTARNQRRAVLAMDNRLIMVLAGQLLVRPSRLMAAVTTEEEALAALKAHCPNLLICENRLETGCTASLCRAAKYLIPEIQILVIVDKDVNQSNWDQLASAADLAIATNDVGDPEFPLMRVFIELARGHKYWSPSLRAFKPGQQALKMEECELSAREQQIIELISQGLTDREIASHMNLTHNTTRSYVRDLRHRLKQPSRAALAAWYWNKIGKRS